MEFITSVIYYLNQVKALIYATGIAWNKYLVYQKHRNQSPVLRGNLEKLIFRRRLFDDI